MIHAQLRERIMLFFRFVGAALVCDREMRTVFHKDCVLSFSVGTNITEIYDILCGCHLSKNNYSF